MSILNSSIVPVGTSGGYSIDNSCRFNDDDSSYLSRTPSVAGNRKVWTWSGWVKRGNIGVGSGSFFATSGANQFLARFETANNIQSYDYSGSFNLLAPTTAVYRDPSSWYHIVLAWDTTQTTAADRFKIYINSVEQATGSTYPAQNYDGYVNSTVQHQIGYDGGGYLDGHLSEVHFIDGQALDPSNFGETGDYGEWKPIKYEGTYGTNGFYLDFENSGSLGADVSGNGNNWTPTNLAATDQMLDSPTNNFCTLNRVWQSSSSQGAMSEGNLKAVSGEISTFNLLNGSGKWYWEVEVSSANGYTGIGFTNGPYSQYLRWNVAYGSFTNAGAGTLNIGTQTAQINCTVMMAFDEVANKFWMGVNGVWFSSGNPSTGSNPALTLAASSTGQWFAEMNLYAGGSMIYNFGQDSSFAGNKTAQGNSDDNGIGDFYYTPPTGFLALCTQNLPDPAVIPSEHFNTVTYTGTGSAISVSGVGFQPDWVWGKNRAEAWNHYLFDAVRGTGKLLQSNLTNAETNNDVWGYLSAFNSDGFSLSAGSSGIDQVNDINDAYVAWNWKANGAGVSNTNGTITSTVSANVDAGFSIVSYTGNGLDNTTIGHGLTQAPELIIVKNRDVTANWFTYVNLLGANKYLLLDSNNAEATDTDTWNNTNTTSSVFHLGGQWQTDGNGNAIIAYCFHSVDGYSKVGSYTGNGSTDGPFVHCGFRPAYVMIKDTTATHHWWIWDTARNTYNEMDEALVPNLSVATQAPLPVDSLSNGFKFRTSNTQMNTSGNTYIFLAFAEHPFKYTNAR